LINDYNCNEASNRNKKWISRNEKALENFEIKTAPDGKKYVYENFKDLIDLDNWQIEGDVLMQEGSDFW